AAEVAADAAAVPRKGWFRRVWDRLTGKGKPGEAAAPVADDPMRTAIAAVLARLAVTAIEFGDREALLTELTLAARAAKRPAGRAAAVVDALRHSQHALGVFGTDELFLAEFRAALEDL
ncbi:MAG: hypothetical protein K8W52_02140, partial [Deltaproteobacteria bacterium]|nr:hypothetical protein [Deltaproteobacteria bacterium]